MLKRLALSFLRTYQKYVSRWLGNRCRFFPNCSSYAMTAIERYGVCRGGFLTIKRLCKCHPFHEGGIDNVP